MRYKNDDGSLYEHALTTIIEKKAPSSYIGFDKYNTGSEARSALQIKGAPESWSDARLRGEFDTLQLFDGLGSPRVRIPRMFGDTKGMPLEPFTKAYPKYGIGGARQLHADWIELHFKKVDIISD